MAREININRDWRFFPGDLEPHTTASGWGGAKAKGFGFGAAKKDLDDSGWKQVNIPHDFVVEREYTKKQETFGDYGNIPAMETIDTRLVAGGSLEPGVGWYRKHFDAPIEWDGKRIFLLFEGVYRGSIAFLNHYDIGSHQSGYTKALYEITDYLTYGGDNLLAVRVDASEREGWWYEGGGIYRDVKLIVTDSVHFEQDSIFIRSGSDLHTVLVTAEAVNQNTVSVNTQVSITILNPSGTCVASEQKEITIDAWDSEKVNFTLHLDEICLWDLDTPQLYQACISVTSKQLQTEDTMQVSFGIRSMKFDVNNGFFLNEKPIKIKGVCWHQDHAGLGIAVPRSVWEYRLKQIKEMGANALRCSHHPQSPDVLELCDRMGILVMDETRKLNSSAENREQLRSMVRSDRNHPCIFMWSVGNEETAIQDKEEGGHLVRTARMDVRKEDDTRPVTMAFCGWNGEYFHDPKVFLPASKELDVMGFNYMPEGWEEYHRVMPEQPIIVTEASTNSGTRGCYQTDAAQSQYYLLDEKNQGVEIKKDVAEHQWKLTAELPYISGIFLWTALDYRGEPTPFTYPAVYSQFGVMDACGFAKDNYYYYKSWWSSEKVLHIFPDWNQPDKTGKPLTVYCYSNADEVELFVNGISQGRKKMIANWYLQWDNVIYQPGKLHAIGYWKKEDATIDTMETVVETIGAPYRIVLEPQINTLRNINDIALINVSVQDEKGRVVPWADPQIRFYVENGILVGCGNGNPGSHESDKSVFRRAFHGLCQIAVQAGDNSHTSEPIMIRAMADGLLSGTTALTYSQGAVHC